MDKIIEDGISKLKKDIFTYPVENSKKRVKRLIKNLLEHGEAAPDRFFWPHAMMVDALWCYYEKTGDQESFDLINQYYQKHIGALGNIKYPDTVMNGYRLIDLYEKTWKPEYKFSIDKMADYLLNTPKASDGSILYRVNQKEQVYADTIGMIVPFLFRYGAMQNDSRYSDLATNQILNFIKNGMDVESDLPYHAYNATTGLKQGIIGWGRAVGWIFMGVADGIVYADDTARKELINIIEGTLPSAVKYQRKDGLFSWQLQAVDGPEDISATGMILSSVNTLLGQGLLNGKYKEVVDKGLIAIKEQSGAYNKCLAECEALGCYPQVYSEYPWGTAMVVRFAIESNNI